MPTGWGGAVLLAVALLWPLPGSAQQRVMRHEFGLTALAGLADPAFVGGGLYGALRPAGNARLGINLLAGTRHDRFAGRGELLAHLVLSPRRTRGAGLYGIGGIAAVAGAGSDGYVVLGLGLESAPGGRSGWAVEVGVGGGLRLAVGWRYRQ